MSLRVIFSGWSHGFPDWTLAYYLIVYLDMQACTREECLKSGGAPENIERNGSFSISDSPARLLPIILQASLPWGQFAAPGDWNWLKKNFFPPSAPCEGALCALSIISLALCDLMDRAFGEIFQLRAVSCTLGNQEVFRLRRKFGAVRFLFQNLCYELILL